MIAQAFSNQVISPTVPSATECRLCSDLESAAMAVARPATTKCLLQKGRRPLCASSRAQGSRRPPSGAGSVSCCSEHQCPATAANQQMHCATCHLPANYDKGLEIQPDLHSFSFRFHSIAYSIAYSMLSYHTFLWNIAGGLYHSCAIQQLAISHLFCRM